MRTLGLTDIGLRFVEDRTADADDLAAWGPDAWRGVVEVRYRVADWDSSETRLETPVVFAPGDGGVRVASIGGADGRTPLWLRGPLRVSTVGRALVLSRDPGVNAYVPLVRRAPWRT